MRLRLPAAAGLAALAVVVAGIPAQGATVKSGKVVRVADGDTVVVKLAQRSKRIELAGISAPEGGACRAAQATARLRALLPRGARVRVRGRDVMRRGRSASVEMVRAGLASPSGSAPGGLADRISDAFDQARNARRGIHACGGGGPGPAPPPAPTATPDTRNTDPEAVKQQLRGTAWITSRFEQAGSGGTTVRREVHLCADDNFKIRNSSTSTDGQGDSFTVISQEFGKPWVVASGATDPGGTDLDAVVTGTITSRRTRSAQQGIRDEQANDPFSFKMAFHNQQAKLDDADAQLAQADCRLDEEQ